MGSIPIRAFTFKNSKYLSKMKRQWYNLKGEKVPTPPESVRKEHVSTLQILFDSEIVIIDFNDNGLPRNMITKELIDAIAINP